MIHVLTNDSYTQYIQITLPKMNTAKHLIATNIKTCIFILQHKTSPQQHIHM